MKTRFWRLVEAVLVRICVWVLFEDFPLWLQLRVDHWHAYAFERAFADHMIPEWNVEGGYIVPEEVAQDLLRKWEAEKPMRSAVHHVKIDLPDDLKGFFNFDPEANRRAMDKFFEADNADSPYWKNRPAAGFEHPNWKDIAQFYSNRAKYYGSEFGIPPMDDPKDDVD